MDNKDLAILAAKQSGSGGSVTPASVLTALESMSAQQAEDALDAIGGEAERLIVTITEVREGVYAADKTIAQVNAANAAGRAIVFKLGSYLFPASYLSEGAYIATGVLLSDGGDPARNIAILYNALGVGVVNDGPYAPAPLAITCTMTSQTGGTWSGATWAELLNSKFVIASIPAMGVTCGISLAGDAVGLFSSPIYYNGVYVNVNFRSNGMFDVVGPDYGEKSSVVTVSDTTPTIEAQTNTIYECGELTSLTVYSFPASGDFIIRFTSGATATTTTFPASIKFPEAFAAEANTRYEINVSNGYALAVGWPTT